jgi:hypothetical protein
MASWGTKPEAASAEGCNRGIQTSGAAPTRDGSRSHQYKPVHRASSTDCIPTTPQRIVDAETGEPPAQGRNGEHDFKGEARSNETHGRTSDDNARLFCKGNARR